VVTLFAPVTQYATEGSLSTNSGSFFTGEKQFEASVTATNLGNAVKADNEHCARNSSLTASEWTLIGVANGMEGWGKYRTRERLSREKYQGRY
jgi:hypothetical protein